jgi:hypothetical protein
MNDKTKDGKTKIDVARGLVSDLIKDIPNGIEVAFIVYGHNQAQKCEAVEIVRSLSPLDNVGRATLINKIRSLPAVGATPIALALRTAGQELASAKGPCGLILISDGKETCKGKPAEETARLAKDLNLSFGVNVIGFDVQADEREALEEIARAGKGKYYNAANAAEFRKAVMAVHKKLDEVAKPAPRAETKPADQPKVATPAIEVTKGRITAIALSPLTLRGFPKLKEVIVTKAGARGGSFVDSQVQRTSDPGRPLLVPPGVYDVYLNTRAGANEPFVKNLEVKNGERVRVNTNQVVSAIRVDDPGLEGLKVQSIQVVQPGKKGSFREVRATYGEKLGELIMVPPNVAYDVYLVPDEGKPVLVAEGVTTSPGQILVIGDKKD